ncbi:hypothetical protein K474DRAFT_1663066 [Panus rudis PR-1116 ss-1]|nr:hypothetical protein K474DRAFT_1663066 [Panus rudis PR-1116 ss-1]
MGRINRRWVLLVLLILVLAVYAQDDSDSGTNNTDDDHDSYPFDPILQYRPAFASSLPVQILITGIVLTLSSVLFIHLLFTAQYHWPLAPVNFALQVSAVFTLLVSQIATLQVVLATATRESQTWPYMLTYVAVDIPPLDDLKNSGWTNGELAAWLLMNATTSALIQITHIQFLTLLFPSGLERRLIFTLLGPLALLAAIMQLLPLHDSTDDKLADIASAIQNVCNATLSLLFTAALFIWGFFVNGKNAWRTDGGTAAFGVGALLLAVASTAITFVYIPHKDQYAWMPGLMWAVILWQSFMGWWWWVGSGMGVGEVEDLMRREEKRRRKRRVKLAKRQERKEKVDTFWKGVAGALGYDRRRATASQRDEGEVDGNSSDEGGPPPSGDELSSPTSPRFHRTRTRRTSNDSTLSSTITQGSGFFARLTRFPAGKLVYGWYLRLRHAHLTAAREQAVENVERIQQVYGREGGPAGEDIYGGHGEQGVGVVGWGLGSYGIRQQMVGAELANAEMEMEMEEMAARKSQFSEDSTNDYVSPEERGVDVEVREGDVRRRRGHDPQPEPIHESIPMQELNRTSTANAPVERPPSSSMWWWGPLRRWRLQDSTVYS